MAYKQKGWSAFTKIKADPPKTKAKDSEPKYNANQTDERVFDVNQEKYDKWNRTQNRGKGPDVRHLGTKENKPHLDKYLKFNKSGPMKKKTDPPKNTIDRRHAKRINVENISAVQNKGGKNFVVEVGENEYYDPSAKNNIGGFTGEWKGNYNDWNNKRDTMLVNPSYKVGDLIDETAWETGKATK